RPNPNRPAPSSISQVVRSVADVEPVNETLLVIFDQHIGGDSLLHSDASSLNRSKQLSIEIAEARNVYVLVLTRPERFERMISVYQAYGVEGLGCKVEPDNDRPLEPSVFVRFLGLGQYGMVIAWINA